MVISKVFDGRLTSETAASPCLCKPTGSEKRSLSPYLFTHTHTLFFFINIVSLTWTYVLTRLHATKLSLSIPNNTFHPPSHCFFTLALLLLFTLTPHNNSSSSSPHSILLTLINYIYRSGAPPQATAMGVFRYSHRGRRRHLTLSFATVTFLLLSSVSALGFNPTRQLSEYTQVELISQSFL